MQFFLRALRVLRAFVANLLMFAAAGCPPEEGEAAWSRSASGHSAARARRSSSWSRNSSVEHPGIRVRVQQIPWIAAHEKLLTAYVGDATPDLAQIGNTWIPEFAALGALEPLDAWVESVGRGGLGRVLRRDLEHQHDRRHPVRRSLVRGHPRDLLPHRPARAGRLPRDARHLGGVARGACEAIKRDMGPGSYPIFLPTNEWAQPVRLRHAGGLHRCSTARGATGRSPTPPFAGPSSSTWGCSASGLAPALGNVEIANVYQEFARGGFAMWITGPWNLGRVRASRIPADLQDDWATAPLPAPAGDSAGRLDRRRRQPGDVPPVAAQGGGLEAGGVSLRAGAAGAVLPADRRPAGASRCLAGRRAGRRPQGPRVLAAAPPGPADPQGARGRADRDPGLRVGGAGDPGRASGGHGAGGPRPRTWTGSWRSAAGCSTGAPRA